MQIARLTPAHYFLALAHSGPETGPATNTAEFEKVIHTPYVTPEMYNALASLYIRNKQFAEAENLCRKAIALEPLTARRATRTWRRV